MVNCRPCLEAAVEVATSCRQILEAAGGAHCLKQRALQRGSGLPVEDSAVVKAFRRLTGAAPVSLPREPALF